jgi:hypothetical protein
MTGEQVIERIFGVYNGYRAQNLGKRPLYLYISTDRYDEVKRTSDFANYFLSHDGTVNIFGMEPVEVLYKQDFIRVGN